MKIKIFLWYLRQGVLLTKDNLRRRNWNGSPRCCFCDSAESIHHLFFDYVVARVMRRLCYMVLGCRPPVSVPNMFRNWLNGMGGNMRDVLLVGAAAICWAIWLHRNEVIFDKKIIIIYRLSSWLPIDFVCGLSFSGSRPHGIRLVRHRIC